MIMPLQESPQGTKSEKLTLPNIHFITCEYYNELVYLLPTSTPTDNLNEFFEIIQYNRKMDDYNPPLLVEVAAFIKQFAGYDLEHFGSKRGLYGWFMVCGQKTIYQLQELDYINNADYWILRD